MAPSKLMMIRHAEKPLSGAPYGLRSSGEVDPESLTTRGWQRAGALARFFAPADGRPLSVGLATPDTIAASKAEKHGGGASRRPKQTVTPLAKLLGTEIDVRFHKGQEAELMQAMLEHHGTVLIAWEHEHIPALVAALGNTPATPKQWPDDRFDLVWVFDRTDDGWTFSQVPQQLLSGDSSEVLPLA